MREKRRFLASFSIFNIIVVAMCAGLGIASKSVIVPLAHIVTGALLIPGGAVAGGFYMMFLVMAAGLTGKKGAATLAAIVQAVLVIVTGTIGSHGIVSAFTYTCPGIAIDLVLLLLRKHNGCCGFCCMLCGIAANMTGTIASNFVFFRLPFEPLMLTLFAAALSGALGGLVAAGIIKNLKRFNPAFKNASES